MKPMLCHSITPEEFLKLNPDEWVLETKFDGIRAYTDGGKLYNRQGKDITHLFPEIDVSGYAQCFDGEIVAQTGVFSDMSGRVHMKDPLDIEDASILEPVSFIIYDVPNHPGTLEERREYLELRRNSLPGDLALQHEGAWFKILWERVLLNGIEGLVAKRKTSTYQEGKRSRDWLKIKAFKEVIHEFTKYERTPRGITIEDNEGHRVVVNGAQAEAVARKLDREGRIYANIQYLPQQSGVWRFPSFRGLARR